jgi:hypothetical protein
MGVLREDLADTSPASGHPSSNEEGNLRAEGLVGLRPEISLE